MLKDAGWSVRDGKLVDDSGGQQFSFEILNNDPRMEPIILPFIQNCSAWVSKPLSKPSITLSTGAG